ncbi:MAG TPA: DNA ligase D [Polyangia bacterium]|nr:DNA ligase D [Polyangia bacterium]
MLPMLATLADAPLRDPHLVYEPKYDGIRALVTVTPGARGATVSIASRLGNDKTAQFPEIVQALELWARGRRQAVVLDGEIVALDAAGQPLGFGRLQPRIHLTGVKDVARLAAAQPVALFVFDLLREGDDDLCKLPLAQRRQRLEAAFAPARQRGEGIIRLSRQVAGDGEALMAEAQAAGWEGLIAKDARSLYRPGRRTADWRKLKLVKRQEFVVGGWTEPRGSRHRFGALLLGLPTPDGRLRYVGHVGGGFSEDALRAVGARLDELAQKSCPFETAPPSSDKPHWIRPALVAEVRFSEWTQDGNLRHPVFLGLRDDVVPTAIARETSAPPARQELLVKKPATASRPAASVPRPSTKKRAVAAAPPKVVPVDYDPAAVLESLAALEERGSGRLTLPSGDVLELGNLKKVLWPGLGVTKGELLRYYVTIAPLLLPVVRDRPLVMRRFPNGIAHAAFYQHRAPNDVPPGVRAEPVPGDTDVPARLVGGSLTTLLYMTQLAVLSQDPYFSRIQSVATMDFAAIDLDPMDGAPFSRVLDVARWVRDELEALGVASFPKTSGASGLHVYLPLPPGTSYKAGMLFCQIVGELVAKKHPRDATVERTVNRRDPTTVYVDCLQNIEGKTLACAYSARASVYGGASTPLTWAEVDAGVDPKDFTIRTLPARARRVGDLWEGLRASRGIDLAAALARAHARHGR